VPAIGFVVKRDDGTFKGELRTLTITAPLEIRGGGDGTDADYSVWVRDINVGLGWDRVSSNSRPYIKLEIAAPEFGARPLYANLGADATQPDPTRLAIIWNPE
jgi:uncharacterized protein (DUF736 family)